MKKHKLLLLIVCGLMLLIGCGGRDEVAALVYAGSMETEKPIRQITWSQDDLLREISNILNDAEPIKFDVSVEQDYTLELKNKSSGGTPMASTIFYIWEAHDGDSLILYGADVGNGTQTTPQIIKGERAMELRQILTAETQ